MRQSAGTIFINYRRQDTSAAAGRIMDRLVHEFGGESVFFDVDAIPPGVDYVQYLSNQVARTGVMLVIIGPHWTDAADEMGRPRLEDPNDFVRVEIEAAIQRQIVVLPVLVDGATFPRVNQLPGSLRELTKYQAIQLRHESFGADISSLINRLREVRVDHRVKSWAFYGDKITTLLLDAMAAFAALCARCGLSIRTRVPINQIETSTARDETVIAKAFRSARLAGLSLSEFLATIEKENLEIVDANAHMDELKELKEHIDFFNCGLTKPLALARMEYILWNHVLDKKALESVSDYLARFPSGSHAIEARQIRDQLLKHSGANNYRLPRIFLNYRRNDSQDSADRIFEKITEWVPKDNVLMDVDRKSITPGLPVRPQLERLVNSCDMMLVLIHSRWLTEFRDRSKKHESGENVDFVRIEIRAALDRKELMPIVPILLGGTPAPRASDLPTEIQELMQRSAHKIARDNFDEDLAMLMKHMTTYFELRRSTQG